MAQNESALIHPSVVEQCCGRYSINKQGHSLTVTVPRSVKLSAESVILRKGIYDGGLLYLKAVPVDGVLDGRLGTRPTETEEQVDEERIDIYSVRSKGADKLLTIPASDTSRYPEKSKPLVVEARSQDGLVYLKVIPEVLAAETADVSITTSALVAAEDSRSAV